VHGKLVATLGLGFAFISRHTVHHTNAQLGILSQVALQNHSTIMGLSQKQVVVAVFLNRPWQA